MTLAGIVCHICQAQLHSGTKRLQGFDLQCMLFVTPGDIKDSHVSLYTGETAKRGQFMLLARVCSIVYMLIHGYAL